jgi:hypothetical protein
LQEETYKASQRGLEQELSKEKLKAKERKNKYQS